MTLQEILSEISCTILILPNESREAIATQIDETDVLVWRIFESADSSYVVFVCGSRDKRPKGLINDMDFLVKGRGIGLALLLTPVFQLYDSTWVLVKPEALREALARAKAATPIPSLAELVKREGPILVIIPNTLVCIDIANWFDTVVCDYLPLGNFMFNFVLGRKTDELSPVNLTENLRKDIKEHGLTLDHLKTFPVYLTPADKWEPKLLEGEELETFYKAHFCADTPEENPIQTDNVNHPAHYAAGKIETIDFIEDKGFNYRIGNVIKYVSRHDKKYSDLEKQLEDLKKAAWYLEREIKARENALLSRGNG